MSERTGFKPGGIGCGLHRSGIALEHLINEGFIDRSEVEDWLNDTFRAMGACAKLCTAAECCLASDLLLLNNSVQVDGDQTIFPHPRIYAVVD